MIGGGPAGAEVARLLAARGREVLLLERDAAPQDRVCGEFLSREAVLYLRSAGVDLQALGAVPIDTVRVIARDVIAEVALPFEASSLSRRVLDEASLSNAAAQGVRVERGAHVTSLVRTATGHRVELAGGRAVHADAVFVATGKHELRGHKRGAGLQNDLVAFKLHYVLSNENARAIERCVELTLFPGGYAGLQPIERGRANLCLLVRRAHFARCGHQFPALLEAIAEASPHFASRLQGASPCWRKPLAMTSLPYGYVRGHATDDAFWLGDQGAVIPSFSGDGMSIALHSARLAADTFRAGETPETFQRLLSRDVRAQVRLATLLSRALVQTGTQRLLMEFARFFPARETSEFFPARETSKFFPARETSKFFPARETSEFFPARETSEFFPARETSEFFPARETSEFFPARETSKLLPRLVKAIATHTRVADAALERTGLLDIRA